MGRISQVNPEVVDENEMVWKRPIDTYKMTHEVEEKRRCVCICVCDGHVQWRE